MVGMVESQETTLSAVAYPLKADGRLIDSPATGQLIIGSNSLQLQFQSELPDLGMALLIGVPRQDESLAFFGAKVVEGDAALGRRSIRLQRGGIGERILLQENRQPIYDPQQCRFRMAFCAEIYESWRQAGILRSAVLDRILVCPRCSALPTVRFGCCRCHSGRIARETLLHHFACACVAPLKEFNGEQSLKCPKCQTKHLIAGTDFEYAPGQHHCQDCGWKSQESTQIGHCLQCENRFPLHQAIEQELEGYDVDRLDLMALIPFSA